MQGDPSFTIPFCPSDLGPGKPSRTIDSDALSPHTKGKLDDTLIIYISGDNGTSAEGSTIGTPFDMAAIQGIDIPVEDQMKFYDLWGGPETTPHMSVAWSWAFDTPFTWFKQNASKLGGIRQNMAVSWPARIADKGGLHTAYNAMVVHLAPQGHHSQSDIALAKIHFFEAWAQT